MAEAWFHPSQTSPAGRVVVHLADLQQPQHTLCGVPLAVAEVGAYVEQIDGLSGDEDGTWSRGIYPLCGGEADSCARCLAHQQPVLCMDPVKHIDAVPALS